MNAADLIAELQAARPAAGEALRERVRETASAPPVPRRDPWVWLRRVPVRRVTLVALPAAAVLLLAVAGIGGLLGPNERRPQQERTALTDVAPSSAVPDAGAAKAQAPPATSATTPAPTTGRAQRYSAQLTLSVKDVDALSDATQQALRITRDLGGHLVSVQYATADTGVSTLLLKVPTGNVQEAIVRLTGLGTIVSQNVQIEDLQGQVDDLTKQETALLERIARLSARIAQPNLDPEVKATLEARRDAARAQLAQVRTARAQVRAEASEATIQLTLQTSQSSAVPVAPTRWDRSLDRAQEILAVEAEVLLTLLVVLGPAALLGVLFRLGRRTWRRHRDDELLAAR